MRWAHASVAILSVLAAACGQGAAHNRGWHYDATYDDPAKLAKGIERISALEAELMELGYRRSSGEHVERDQGAVRTGSVFRRSSHDLDEVEIAVWHWDQLRPEGKEIGVHVGAAVPGGPDADVAWNELVSWVRKYVDPLQVLRRVDGRPQQPLGPTDAGSRGS